MAQKCGSNCHCPLCDARMAMVMMLDDTALAAWLQQEQRAAAQSLGVTLRAGSFRTYTQQSQFTRVPRPPSMRQNVANQLKKEEENQ